MQRIFSGMQPSGRFHLGNYMGALDNWIKLQKDYECFFSIVDLHALTSSFEDTSKIQNNVMEMAIDWLSKAPKKALCSFICTVVLTLYKIL